jgi:hypothetical protein
MENLEEELKELEKTMLFCEVCGVLLTGNHKKYCSNIECKNKAINARLAKERLENVETFPKYICQHCGFIFQLTFQVNRIEGQNRLDFLKCPNCLKSRK